MNVSNVDKIIAMQHRKEEIYLNIISWINISERYNVWGCTGVSKYYISDSIIEIKKITAKKYENKKFSFLQQKTITVHNP